MTTIILHLFCDYETYNAQCKGKVIFDYQCSGKWVVPPLEYKQHNFTTMSSIWQGLYMEISSLVTKPKQS